MKNRLYKLAVCFLLIHLTFYAQSQPSDRILTRQEYIDLYKEDAVKEMHRTGIPASITLSQALLESGDGNSPLARYANNHFGIKCHNWTGPTFIQDDDTKNECFRKYSDVYESYKDHSEFLKTRDRYAFLFDLPATDYKGWAYGLKKAGYATNPKYPEMLIKIIEENGLDELDKQEKIPSRKHHHATKNYKEIKPSTKEIELDNGYSIKKHENDVEYVIAKKGDTPEKIAKKLDLGYWEINKYNDLPKDASIQEGDLIFIKPKRKESKKFKIHTVAEGETLWMISQKYGVKLKRLCKYNGVSTQEDIKTGTSIKLKK